MAVGTEIQLADLPDNLLDSSLPNDDTSPASSWHEQLSRWATHELQNGEQRILDAAVPIFEKSMIEVALQKTNGRKREASLLLGWGRNTLTRKMKELGMKED